MGWGMKIKERVGFRFQVLNDLGLLVFYLFFFQGTLRGVKVRLYTFFFIGKIVVISFLEKDRYRYLFAI